MYKYVLLVALFGIVYAEDLKSPCPELFQYGKADKGTYEATLVLKSDAKLYGVWTRLFFDKPITITKLPEGYEAVKSDDNGVLIKNRDFELLKNTPTKLPITIKYDGDVAPKLTQFRLNARNQCPIDN